MITTILAQLLPSKRVFFILLVCSSWSFATVSNAQPCACTNCPQFMPDFFVGDFILTVQNAANPTLGQNGQGVCGVHIHFDHTAICDLQFTLTSPSGQTVTLIGPINNVSCTNMGNAGSDWDITFLPCFDPDVAPDPGFPPTWSMYQPWGANTNYTGSYYPYLGCLQNFTGPVNGDWILNITDGQANDAGNLYTYEIIFCDPSGIDCFNCLADAGNLQQPDVVECEGSVNLSLPPTYSGSAVAPPTSEYSYAYVIAGAGGVILDIPPTPDLSSLPAGVYTVCGLSYITSAAALLPTPNGLLTVNQLRNALNSSQPPFCGDVSDNCVGVTIKALPPDIEETAAVCAPDCYDFYGQFYCATNTYQKTLFSNGCPYTATLHLTVNQPNNVFLNETICTGTCSANPLFPTACTAGNYQQTVQNALGCDSTVHLNLIVIPVIANIQQPVPVLTCAQTSVLLQGTGSTVGAGTTYQWTASNGGHIVGPNTNIDATVDKPGNYQLRVCRSYSGGACCDTANVIVVANQSPPAMPVLTGVSNLCSGQTATYSVVPIVGATGYTWTVPAGATIDAGQNTPSINITWNSAAGGTICVTANNLCGPGLPACLNVSTTPALVATQPLGLAVVCADSTTAYNIPLVTNATSYNWTVSAPATIVSGQGTNVISVHWGNAAMGSVCVSALGTCGSSLPVCLPVAINTVPVAPTVSGPVQACAGTSQNYTLAAVPGATTYNWSVIGGTVITGNGTTTVQVLWSGTIANSSVCATASGACGQSPSNCLQVSVTEVPAPPDITGTFTLCTGDTGNYSINAVPGATGYTWLVPSGGTIISGQNTTAITVDWTTGSGGDVCATADNVCGSSTQNCFQVGVLDRPMANAGVDDAVCGTTFNLSAVPSIASINSNWTSASGAPGSVMFTNITSATTTATVSQNGIYAFIWTESNGVCMDRDTIEVHFNASPVAGQFLPTCDAANQNYTVVFPVTGGTPPYTIPGGSFVNGNFTSNPIPSGQTFSFTVTDANGCTATPVSGAFACNCSSNAGQMSQQVLSACPGGSVTAQQQGGVLDSTDMGAYVLHTNAGPSLGAVLAENTSGTFSFGTGMTYGTTYYISYVVGDNLNGLPDQMDPCLAVAMGQPVTFFDNPVANAGLDSATCGLSLPLQGNTGSGTAVWTLISSPNNATAVIADPQNAATSLNTNTFGDYTLRYTLTSNGCTGSDDLVLTFHESPAAGPIQRSCDGTNQNYSVAFPIIGGTAPYTVDGISVAGTSFVSDPQPSGQTFGFIITDANGCSSPTISGTYNCNCATNAGQMDLTMLTACGGDNVVAQLLGGQNLDANDTTSWVLHTGAGTVLGTILGQNHTGQFTFGNGMTYGITYYISQVAGNDLNGFPDPSDPCFSVAQGQPVVFLEQPSPNAGSNFAVCSQTATLAAVNSGFSGSWSQVSGTGTATFIASTSPSSPVSVDAAGSYIFRWTETNGICSDEAEVTVSFQEIPTVTGLTIDCNNTNTGYTVNYMVNGGLAPYTVNGLAGNFSGATFTSILLSQNAVYTFTVTDANGCTTQELTGSHFCNCSTDAGTMLLTPATFCAGQSATATWNNNANLDADDAVQYILHNQSGASLGTVYATNQQPTFAFGPGLQTGVVYYISAIAGNSNGGTIDLNDPCLSIAAGTAVQWKPLPTATLNGDVTICAGSSAALSFTGTGTYPLQLSYSDGTTTQPLLLPSAIIVALNVSPTTTTTYTLLSVSDGTPPTCSADLSNSITVTVNEPVSAGTAAAPVEICAGIGSTIQLSSLLQNADPGGQWSETSSALSQAGAFNTTTGTFQTAAQFAGTYTFQYQLTALAPCPTDKETVKVILNALPVADAGPDQTIDCNQPSVTLGVVGTGTGTLYDWTLNGTSVGQTAQQVVTDSGKYNLLATNSFGCIGKDSATVLLDQELPQAIATVQPVRCFGDENGSITLDSIVSTHPPVLFSVNGGPFSSSSVFSHLGPGTYTVTLQAANGCEWSTPALVLTQPTQLLVDLGPSLETSLGDSVYLTAQTSVPFSALQSVFWNPTLDLVHADTLIQYFLPLDSKRITVRLTDANGCTASSSVLVHVDRHRHVYIGNIVKPGSSNFNDQLVVYGGRDVAEVESFQVYDRWGALVFENRHFQANDATRGWNGMHNGKTTLPGVYVYYAVVRFVDGETEVFEGDVTVLR